MIRPAVPDDLAAIVALEADLFGIDAWTEEQVRTELEGPGRLVQVSDGEVVSGYVVTRLAGDLVDLLRIGVRHDRQRSGLATALVGAAMQEAKRAGAVRMLLEVGVGNAAARALYAAHGFAELDRRPRYYRDGSDALVLAIEL